VRAGGGGRQGGRAAGGDPRRGGPRAARAGAPARGVRYSWRRRLKEHAMAKQPHLEHPAFAVVKAAFPDRKLGATEFRGQSALIVEPQDLHEVMALLKTNPKTDFNFLSDVAGADYLIYPAEMPGRFAVVYNLISFARDDRFWVKTYLNPSLPTDGIEKDPALEVASMCDLWPRAEWPAREAY